jgi:hypothetical protein
MMQRIPVTPSSIQIIDTDGVHEVATACEDKSVNITCMTVSPDGAKVAMFSQTGKTIHLFSTHTLEDLAVIPVPDGLELCNGSFNAAGDELLALLIHNEKGILVVDLITHTARIIPDCVGENIGSAGYTHNGHKVIYATNQTMYIVKTEQASDHVIKVAEIQNIKGKVEGGTYYWSKPMLVIYPAPPPPPPLPVLLITDTFIEFVVSFHEESVLFG